MTVKSIVSLDLNKVIPKNLHFVDICCLIQKHIYPNLFKAVRKKFLVQTVQFFLVNISYQCSNSHTDVHKSRVTRFRNVQKADPMCSSL